MQKSRSINQGRINMEKIISNQGTKAYSPTPDDEVQITRRIQGIDVYYGIVKKDKLSILDRIKKFLKIADEWIDYTYVRGIVPSPMPDMLTYMETQVDIDVMIYAEKKYDIHKTLWNTVKSLSKNHIQDAFIIYGRVYGTAWHMGEECNSKNVNFAGTDIFEHKNFVAPDAVALIFDHVLELPHIEILHTGEWSEEVQDECSKNIIENDKNIINLGVVIKHVSGDREKITMY